MNYGLKVLETLKTQIILLDNLRILKKNIYEYGL